LELGWLPIPVKTATKAPAIEGWKDLQDPAKRPTDQEILGWFKEEDNIAILCGRASGNLVVIDFDDNSDCAAKLLGENIGTETAVSKTGRTDGKGRHYFFKSGELPKNRKIPGLGELRSDGNYVVVPPSRHPSGNSYEWLSKPETVKQVQNLTWFFERAKELDFQIDNSTTHTNVSELKKHYSPYTGPQPQLITEMLDGVPEGQRDDAAIKYASWLVNWLQFGEDDVWNRMVQWNEKNRPPLEQPQLRKCYNSAKSGGYSYAKVFFPQGLPEGYENRPNTVAYGNNNIKYVPFIELPDGRLAEQGYDSKNTYYLVYDPEKHSVTKADSFLVDGITYSPILDDFVKNRQVILPSDATEYEDEEKLFEEVKKHIEYWYEEPDDKQLIIDSLYVFFTYVADLVPISPYLRRYGRFGGGKTTANTVIGELCHRSFKLAGCSTEASIRRVLDRWRGTAIIDEADFSRNDLYAVIVKILNIGHDAKQAWYICCDENDPNKTLSFYVYGPKVLATRERWKDNALESRCISVQSVQNHSAKPLYQAEKFTEQRQKIVNKLQMWRFKNRAIFKQRLGNIEDPDIVKQTFGRDFKVESRIKQVMVPLGLIMNNQTVKDAVGRLMIQQEDIINSLDEERQLEQQVREAVRQLILNRLENPRELTKLTKLTSCSSSIRFTVKEITLTILGTECDSQRDKGEVTGQSKRITKYLRDRLGLSIRAGTGNVRQVDFPVTQLLAFLKVSLPNNSLTKLPSLTREFWESILKELKQRDTENGQKQDEQQLSGEQVTSSELVAIKTASFPVRALQVLHKIKGPFTDDYAADLIMETGLSREEAASWIDRMINDCLLVRDPEGYLNLVKGL
jgi:hypothetical protein